MNYEKGINGLQIVGLIFILMSGLLYTLERFASMVSTSVIRAGFFSGSMTGEVPSIEVSNFSDNFFVPVFFFGGIILFMYGLAKNNKGRSS